MFFIIGDNIMDYTKYDILDSFVSKKYNEIKPKNFQDLFIKCPYYDFHIFSKIMAWNIENLIINKNVIHAMTYNNLNVNYSYLNFSQNNPKYFFTDGGYSQKRQYVSASIILNEDFTLHTIIVGHANIIKQDSLFHEKMPFLLTEYHIKQINLPFNDMMWFTDLELRYCLKFLKDYNDLIVFCNYKKDCNFSNIFYIDGICDSITKSNSLKRFFCKERKYIRRQGNYEITYNKKTKFLKHKQQ